MTNQPNPNLIIAVPWPDQENYETICKMAGSSWNMEAEFSAWRSRAQRSLETLRSEGRQFKLIDIDAKVLRSYCARHSIPINSSALGDFAVELFNNQLPSPIAIEGNETLRPHDITIRNITVGKGWGPAVSAKDVDRISVSGIVRTEKQKN